MQIQNINQLYILYLIVAQVVDKVLSYLIFDYMPKLKITISEGYDHHTIINT